MALTFCDSDERPDLRAIEKLVRQPIPVVEGHPFESNAPPPAPLGERDLHERSLASKGKPQGQQPARNHEPKRNHGRRDRRRRRR
jgi:ATP-dependent RNA helicase RhlE